MNCSKCGTVMSDNTAICRNCGFSIAGNINELSENNSSSLYTPKKEIVVGENEKKTKEILPAKQGKRVINYIIDWSVIMIFSMIIGFISGVFYIIAGLNFPTEQSWFGDVMFGLSVMFIYYIPFEYKWGRTFGKCITKTKVVDNFGNKPEFSTIVVRNLSRMIPFEAFSFLIGSRPVGWHDSLSKTFVIDSGELEKLKK